MRRVPIVRARRLGLACSAVGAIRFRFQRRQQLRAHGFGRRAPRLGEPAADVRLERGERFLIGLEDGPRIDGAHRRPRPVQLPKNECSPLADGVELVVVAARDDTVRPRNAFVRRPPGCRIHLSGPPRGRRAWKRLDEPEVAGRACGFPGSAPPAVGRSAADRRRGVGNQGRRGPSPLKARSQEDRDSDQAHGSRGRLAPCARERNIQTPLPVARCSSPPKLRRGSRTETRRRALRPRGDLAANR